MEKILTILVDQFTNGYCINLARSLHVKTGFPIYAIYDTNDKINSWGIDYFHFFVKIGDDLYLNAGGIRTEQEMIDYWAKAWDDPNKGKSFCIIKKDPEHILTGCSEIDEQLEIWGSGITIADHTKQFADLLISVYLSNK